MTTGPAEHVPPPGDPTTTARPRLTDLPTGVTPAGAVTARPGADRGYPAPPPLAELLPGGVFRRGSSVEILNSGSLMLAVIAAAIADTRSWTAAVGMPDLGCLAAAEHGIDLKRFALVPHPGAHWPTVVAALVDGFDVVAVRPPSPLTGPEHRRLAARVRQRGALLIATQPWDNPDVTLRVTNQRWYGLGQGTGRLKYRTATVTIEGRGALNRAREITLWMPSPNGDPIATYDGTGEQISPASPAIRTIA
ncbi:hypothetical protein [Phytohabitans aurantiacus]|uniref:Recombinase A n=1 Tax=Phytohabitans aurantiacus TaxID=3016789 RepID=A0ABQ5QNP9_9ACTN|nr:hypothetical protein [Phytohabitans aurantiacus]GLH96296.1 hypothetical protein Pa4123_15700 [Phytohabitans aurantiacus]